MQGYWENGKYILASTQQEKIERLEAENERFKAALEEITAIPDTGAYSDNFLGMAKMIANKALAGK